MPVPLGDAHRGGEFDPVTGHCLLCGATREDLHDGLYPVCDPIMGPHRLALILIRRAQHYSAMAAADWRRSVQEHETAIVLCEAKAREAMAAATELQHSFNVLRGEQLKKLSVGEAIDVSEAALGRGFWLGDLREISE